MKNAILLALLLAGCTMVPSDHSGFLPDYAILERSADDPDTERWLAPDAGYYGQLMVAPFVAYFHENVRRKPVDANELDHLLTRLRSAVIDAVDESYFLATEPGPGVLRLEVAVTDLHKQSGSISGLGLQDANVEMRGVDSQSGALVFAAVYSRKLTGIAAEGEDKWAAVRAVAARWAERVKNELAAAEVE